MKKHMKSLPSECLTALVALIAVTGTLADASATGKEGGNGGNAVVCFDSAEIAKKLTPEHGKVSKMIPDDYLPRITSITTLDLYDATRPVGLERTVPKIEPIQTEENLNHYSIRLAERYSLYRFPLYRGTERFAAVSLQEVLNSGIHAIGDRIRLELDSAVYPVNDIAPLARASENCVYSTVAVQEAVGGNKRKLTIDGRLFYHARHSRLSQAALMAHEYFLASHLTLYTLYEGLQKTEPVREFVAALMQRGTTAFTLLEIMQRRGLFYGADAVDGTQNRIAHSLLSLPGLENFIRQLADSERAAVMDEGQKLLNKYSDRLNVLLKQLPPRYTSWARLKPDLSDLPKCIPTGRSPEDLEPDYCLEGEALQVRTRLNAFLQQLKNEHLPSRILRALQGEEIKRMSEFETLLEGLRSNGISSEEVFEEIRAAYTVPVQTGRVSLANFVGRSVRTLPEFQLGVDPRAVGAGVNQR